MHGPIDVRKGKRHCITARTDAHELNICIFSFFCSVLKIGNADESTVKVHNYTTKNANAISTGAGAVYCTSTY